MSIVTLNNRALKDATTVGTTTSLGNLVFISRSTASSSSSVSITSGIDSTYKEYIFVFNNIHPSNDSGEFDFNLSSDGGSNYNVTKTSSMFRTYNYESISVSGVGYEAGLDLAQSTDYQSLYEAVGNDNDQSGAGFLHLFDPSNTTFVKHYISTMQYYGNGDFSMSTFLGGYANTTSAINAIDFKMSAGTFDAGTIDLYGVK